MQILIGNKQTHHQIPMQKIHQILQMLLNALGYRDSELSVLIVDDLQISRLNRIYLGKDGPTNVIAFPMNHGAFQEINSYLLGDIVISVDAAEREADDVDLGILFRFVELVIHGLLHLVGYDHLKGKHESNIMDKMSEELLLLVKPVIS